RGDPPPPAPAHPHSEPATTAQTKRTTAACRGSVGVIGPLNRTVIATRQILGKWHANRDLGCASAWPGAIDRDDLDAEPCGCTSQTHVAGQEGARAADREQ